MMTNNTSTNTTSSTKKETMDFLTEPLLPLVEAVAEKDDDKKTSSPSNNNIVRAKIVTSLLGCTMAVLSHSILSILLWKDSILHANTMHIIAFSLSWSFWTCVILFVGMLAFVSTSSSSSSNTNTTSSPSSSNSTKNEDNLKDQQQQQTQEMEDEDDRAFQVEAHYVVASLLTISAIWMLDSIVLSFGVGILLCLIVANMDQDIMSSYSLVAGTLGLIFGACSQFILSLWMWQDVSMTQPIINHIVWFSLAWSLLTVVMTFLGCLSLRWVVEGKTTGGDHQSRRRRAILRMEAVYVAMTLVGICAAWIFLDVTAGLPEQIFPSLLMLIVSLAAFTLILQCFPEEDCLEQEILSLVENISADNMIMTTPMKTTKNNIKDDEEGILIV
jgi:hypothetical protein